LLLYKNQQYQVDISDCLNNSRDYIVRIEDKAATWVIKSSMSVPEFPLASREKLQECLRQNFLGPNERNLVENGKSKQGC
jgi:hypothetical protein